jgi:flagellar biosynthesis protein FlhB
MPFGDDAERTEAATPRRQKAREEGQAVKSRKSSSAVFLSNVFFSFASTSLYEHMLTLTREVLSLWAMLSSPSLGCSICTRAISTSSQHAVTAAPDDICADVRCHLLWIGFLFH